MSTKRVLVLADTNMPGALRTYRAISELPGVEPHILVCNHTNLTTLQQRALLWSGLPFFTRLGLRLRGRLHVFDKPLHDETVLAWLRAERFWLGLHGMGVIYRQSSISAFERGILNAHIGILPEFKGRSVMEWSLLAGAPTGVTTFFIDTGIDTGRDMIVKREVSVAGRGDILVAKNHLFSLDWDNYREAVRRLLDPAFQPEINEGGRRYYVMSNLLREVVTDLLK